jgi:hypothetical protein
MKPSINRPDTPLAPTPEPQPVSSGLQPSTQMGAMPVTKYQATADAAIKQINDMSVAQQQAQQAKQAQQQDQQAKQAQQLKQQ